MSSKNDRQVKKKKDLVKGEDVPSGFNVGRVKDFAAEVKTEFAKIVWPAKKQAIASTGVVVVLVVMISFYLGAVDLLLGKIIGLVLR
ncbi:MAG: preprotein translocase subunit SecE [Desulfobulbaceae bacterium]|nr:preprotein translocase subunit SecE [Desulfobulbaceae bacterium]HIJ79909.1 preprotein translocase subunit SecE [Deltaproteobacteria bacterium]